MPTSVTVIATVLNEGANIHRLMRSLASQTRLPDAVIIVDGGSTDDTTAIIESYAERLPLHLIHAPGCSISAGRNIAIDAAHTEVIAATDAGVELVAGWLDALMQPFEADPRVAMVGGFFIADPHSAFEVAMGATVLPLRDEIDAAHFLPSSRSVAFRHSLSVQVGGYPEWLDYCEDLIFDIRMKAAVEQAGQRFVFVPDAVARFQPRGSLRSFYTQYYRYARGDGKADLWRKRHVIRYLTYLGALPAIAGLGLGWSRWLWGLAVLGGIVYLRRPYQRLPQVWQHTDRDAVCKTPLNVLRVLLLIPLIRVVGDLAKMHGYPVGWRWRRQHQPPDWRP